MKSSTPSRWLAAIFAAACLAILSGCSTDQPVAGFTKIRPPVVTEAGGTRITRPALYQASNATGVGKPVFVRSLDNPNTFIEVGVLNAQD